MPRNPNPTQPKPIPKKTTSSKIGPDSLSDFFSDKSKEDNSITAEEMQKINYFQSVMHEIFSIENIDVRSNLQPDLILPLAIARTVDKIFHIDVIGLFADNLEILSISKGGRSRNDMVEIAKGLYPNELGSEQQERRVLSDRLMGKRR